MTNVNLFATLMIFDMKNPFTNIPIKECGNGRLASSVILIIATFTYELAMSTVGERFARRLASNDLSVRNRALKRLSEWIKARSALEDGKSFKKVSLCAEMELLKLWKGLHVCMWHSDKPLVQVCTPSSHVITSYCPHYLVT